MAFNTAFDQAMMDDLVVVPAMTLNPKKAKKKLKKASRSDDCQEVSQLPVYQEAKAEVSPLGFSLPPAKEVQRPTMAKSSPKNRCQVRSAPAPKPVAAPAYFRPAPTVLAKPAPEPQTCAVQAKLATFDFSKRSWFDITEEDEDDFIGLSFAHCSGAPMIA